MGSYCFLKFDELCIEECKSYIPIEYALLFQETNRKKCVKKINNESIEVTVYESERSTILQRLSLLGITQDAVEKTFERWISNEKAYQLDIANESNHFLKQDASCIYDILDKMTFCDWKRTVHLVLNKRYCSNEKFNPQSQLEKLFFENEENFLYMVASGYLINKPNLIAIRAFLEACPDIQNITLDVTELIQNGYYNEVDNICKLTKDETPIFNHLTDPIVILGEGKTDITVLRVSLEKMYPDLLDYFSFFDHLEFKVDGGANYLVKFIKAFAAAKIKATLVVLFDNDTKGVTAFNDAKILDLPPNILITTLPNITLGQNYPTVGPTGIYCCDINGKAAGIEMYLGKASLMKDGAFRPIRWTGYDQNAKAYNGEIVDKSDVLVDFQNKINLLYCTECIKLEFPELEQVWERIFAIVERYREKQWLSYYKA